MIPGTRKPHRRSSTSTSTSTSTTSTSTSTSSTSSTSASASASPSTINSTSNTNSQTTTVFTTAATAVSFFIFALLSSLHPTVVVTRSLGHIYIAGYLSPPPHYDSCLSLYRGKTSARAPPVDSRRTAPAHARRQQLILSFFCK